MSANSAWRQVFLGEVCEFKYGKSLPAKDRAFGVHPVYGSNGTVGYHDRAITSSPTIVIGRKGSFGEVHYSETPCWPIDTTYYVDEDCTRCDLKWLSYRLANLGLTALNRAAAVPGLNREDAYRKRFLLPPLAEQRRTVCILGHVEWLRARRREAIALLDELAQSIFLDMFGEPDQNPHMFDIEKLVNRVPQSDKINYGVVQPGEEFAGGVPLVRAGDLRAGRIDQSAIKRIDPAISRKYSRSEIKGNEVLVCCVGSIGMTAIVDESTVGFNIARAIARVPVESNSEREYVSEHIQTRSTQSYFDKELRTVAQPTLNIKQLSSAKIMVPPRELVDEFARRVASVRRAQYVQQSHLAELDALFASLQDRAFRGELWTEEPAPVS